MDRDQISVRRVTITLEFEAAFDMTGRATSVGGLIDHEVEGEAATMLRVGDDTPGLHISELSMTDGRWGDVAPRLEWRGKLRYLDVVAIRRLVEQAISGIGLERGAYGAQER